MKRFEYDVTIGTVVNEPYRGRESLLPVILELNEKGGRGWELVQIETSTFMGQTWVWRMWKRELEDDGQD